MNLPFSRLFRRSLLAVALTPCFATFADELPDDDAAKSKVETIEVHGEKLPDSYLTRDSDTATKLNLSVLETPQSISIINRSQLDDFNLNNINEALELATGVQVEQVETDRTYYTARGFDITNFQVDGVGLPLTYGNAEGDFDTAIYQRIEVLRGANGLMAGAGNPAATINLVRKRPTSEFQASAGLSYGSWSTARLDADVSGSLTENVRGRVVVAAQQGDSYLEDYALDKNIIYAVVDAFVTPQSVLTFGVSQQQSNADSPLWGALPLYYTDGSATDYDVSKSTSADWAYWDSKETNLFAEYEYQFSNGWLAKAVYSQSDIDGDSELFYMFGTPDRSTEAGLTGYASAYVLNDKKDIFDLFASGSFTLGGREHDMVLGFSWSETEIEDQSWYDYTNGFPPIPNFAAWNGDYPRPNFVDIGDGSQWTEEQTAVYFASRFSLTDALSLIAGVRVLDWQSEGVSYSTPQNAEANGKTLPYGGLVYGLTDQVSLYASYTETFMPQGELGADLTRLAPAEGSSAEIGFKSSFFDDALIASFAYFDAEHTNIAEYAYFDTVALQNIYAGTDYYSNGYEFEVAGRLADGWQLVFGFTDLDIEDRDGNADRTFVPRQVLRLATSYRPPSFDALQFGMRLDWQDDIHRDAGSTAIRQDSYALIDLFANYHVNEQINVSVHVNNATDEKYIQSLYWEQGYYGAPRNYTLTLNWRY
ncbi:TonB-dependent siderophore receptor [Permianibacter aggregans]|uniref:Outer membrane receptor for ferric coprogen and ferric-rhodotorulic acid n=1 Tax=Permianibacter aggregans TaxID=1510150 RepID=A0A4R6UM19_9GAMM|nr:TonB-dependent siderophore receptor [Permianibacter aggregans]TDQ48118.1 outer membrane receptor for ferric coprogen and ferric-rhodotorulic acid [Permianibacter aggregans]